MSHTQPRPLAKREIGSIARGADLLLRFGKLTLAPNPTLRRDAQRTGTALHKIALRFRLVRTYSEE